MAINVGEAAPDFTVKDQDNKDWTLSAQRGKTVVLLWYPLDWSPTCEKENCSVSQEKSLYGPNRVVVGISRDSVWSHKAWKDAKKIGHDLLEDAGLKVSAKYGLVHPGRPDISHRATVIVNPEGNVSFVQVQEKTPEARDMAAVIGALK